MDPKRATGLLIVIGLIAAGCSSAAKSSSQPAELPSSSTTVPSKASASTPSGQTGTTAATTATSSPATTTGPTPECLPSDLRATWPDDRNGASGVLYYSVDIENVAGSACHMTGYFGVSAYSPAGTVIAADDTREADLGRLGTVVLAPGGTAFFQVGFEDSDLRAGGTDCHTLVASLRLIPPDQVSTLEVATPDRLSTSGYPPLCEHRLYVGPLSPRQQ